MYIPLRRVVVTSSTASIAYGKDLSGPPFTDEVRTGIGVFIFMYIV
jgi:hypothetical protein